MFKNVLLTGANGLLGQKIVAKLATREAVGLLATGTGPNRNQAAGEYDYEELDVTDHAAVRSVFDRYALTDVIHCAAMTNVDQCEAEKEKCMALNVDAVKNLADLCREHGVRLIHVSTDFIFDGENGPYREKDAPNPISFYGKSKLLAEDAVLNSGCTFTIVRTVLIYGVVPDMSRSNIVLWAKQALEREQEINVVNDQWRSPTLAEDLADGIILAMMKDKSGIYHISGAEMLNIIEIVRQVADFWNLDAELIHEIDSTTLNQPAKRPPKTGFIILKAQTELGYKPHSFTEGLAIVEKQLEELGK